MAIGTWDVVQIAAPSFTMGSWEYERHQSDEVFRRSLERRGSDEELAPEEVPRRREESFRSALRAQRRSGVQSLVMVLIVLLVDAVLFAWHWRLGRRVGASA